VSRTIAHIRTVPWLTGGLCVLVLAAPCRVEARADPLWDVSGRWDGFNGAEYLVLKQRAGGRLAVTVHHTCAPGHVERGPGRIAGSRLRARVEPAVKPAPPACAAFATIDVRVQPDGRSMRGRYTTDRGAGALHYIGRRRARSRVRFQPRIGRARGGGVRVFLRARPGLPRGAVARVRMCVRRQCAISHGRHAPRIRLRFAGCGLFRARVNFAGSVATARRRMCQTPEQGAARPAVRSA
jgi:hypothetical protein